MKTLQNDSTMIIVHIVSCFHHRTVTISPSYCGIYTIIISQYRIISIVLSCLLAFIIVLSHYHHRTYAFSPTYYCGFIIAPSSYQQSHYHYRCFVIVLSCFLPSFYQVITMVLSRFHLSFIAFSWACA